MKVYKLRNAALVAAMSCLLTACPGNGSGGGVASVVAPTGHVVDGSVKAATVLFDLNDDGICGGALAANAPENLAANQTTTDASGNFTYPAGIAATHIVCAIGGTDISTGATLVGTLKAPAGSTQVTPLTTLVQAVIDAAPAGSKPTAAAAATTIATNLGLGTTINLLTADPVALAATTPKLAQSTTAVQTLLVQAANNVAAAATGAAPTAAQTTALYSSAIAGVAKAVAAQVTPVDLTINTTAGTTAATSLITSAISNTVAAVQSNTTAATAVGGNIATLAPANVAAAAAANVTSVTQTVAVVPAATLVAAAASGVTSVALAAQTNTTGTATTALLANLLTTAASAGAASAVNSTTTLAAAAAAATTDLSNGNAAAAAAVVNNQITQVNAVVTTPIVTVTAPVLTAPTNVLDLSLPTVNGVAVTTTGNPYTVTVTGPLTKATLNVTPVGTPVLPTTSSAGFSVTEVGGNRVLDLVIDQVVVTNVSGVTTVTVPATAKLTAYGVDTAGIVYTAALTNATSNVFTSTANVVTVNWANALTALSGVTGFANFDLAKGKFNVSVVLSGLPLATVASASAVAVTAPTTSVAIPNGAVVTGQSSTIQVVVQ